MQSVKSMKIKFELSFEEVSNMTIKPSEDKKETMEIEFSTNTSHCLIPKNAETVLIRSGVVVATVRRTVFQSLRSLDDCIKALEDITEYIEEMENPKIDTYDILSSIQSAVDDLVAKKAVSGNA